MHAINFTIPGLVVMLYLLAGCQKEVDENFEPIIRDSLVSIVSDFSAGIGNATYDSAVLHFSNHQLILLHHNEAGQLYLTEIITYDTMDRVVQYEEFSSVANTGVNWVKTFQYLGADKLPSAIYDSTSYSGGADVYQASVAAMDSATGIQERVYVEQASLGSAFHQFDTSFVQFNERGQMILYENTRGTYQSKYYYNAATDLDYTSTTSPGEDIYLGLIYTTQDNPLYEIARKAYKNLYPFILRNNINGSGFEYALSIGHYPFEMFTRKLPLKLKLGAHQNTIEEERTYTYDIRDYIIYSLTISSKGLITS